MIQCAQSELFRLEKMSFSEQRLAKEGFSRIAGVDEAGRGPLAGPVVAAACILPKEAFFEGLNDSKKISSSLRETLFHKITNFPGIDFGIGIIDVETIDQINILQATFLAMQQAVAQLKGKPDYLLIDGNKAPHFQIPTETLEKGDSLSVSIAAASIIAKVTRDRIMHELDQKYPQYGFKQHKGYGTLRHRKAIDNFGACPIHRKSFKPISDLK